MYIYINTVGFHLIATEVLMCVYLHKIYSILHNHLQKTYNFFRLGLKLKHRGAGLSGWISSLVQHVTHLA